METVLAKNLVDSSAKAAFPTQQNFEKTNIENKKMFQNWFNSACRCFGLVDTNNWCYHKVNIAYQLDMAAPYTNSYKLQHKSDTRLPVFKYLTKSQLCEKSNFF